MTDFSGADALAAQHPDEVFELSVTRGAKGEAAYDAAVTIFQDAATTPGAMVGTGHGVAPTVGEAIAHAVSDWTPA